MDDHFKNLERECWDKQTNHLDSKKFAEMIIKECAATIQYFSDHRIPASEYSRRLKLYFGIED